MLMAQVVITTKSLTGLTHSIKSAGFNAKKPLMLMSGFFMVYISRGISLRLGQVQPHGHKRNPIPLRF